jgi:hypothetical protein
MLEKIFGPEKDSIEEDCIFVFSTVRNELPRLPYFLAYYRELGVGHFVFIDNASDDGTTDYLRLQNDITIIWTDESYQESRAGVVWLNDALDEYGSGHWCLTVDLDELFVFHGVELFDLKLFCRYLDSKETEAVFAVMLDCYGPNQLSGQRYQPGTSFLRACPYFDGDGYYTAVSERFPYFAVSGGMRRRVFPGKGEAGRGPALNKIPLVRWREGMTYIFSTHAMTPCRLSDVTGVVLHFKFLADFSAEAEAEADPGDRFMPGDYTRYMQDRANHRGSFLYQNSVPFVDSSQLVRCGLLRTTKDWLNQATEAVAAVEEPETVRELTESLHDSLLHKDIHYDRPLHDTLHFVDLVSATLKDAYR